MKEAHKQEIKKQRALGLIIGIKEMLDLHLNQGVEIRIPGCINILKEAIELLEER